MEITVKNEPTYVVEVSKRELMLIEDCVNYVHSNLSEDDIPDTFTVQNASDDELLGIWRELYQAWSSD